jgi:Flp pilus assembly pilin Flp
MTENRAEIRESWREVASKAESLGLKLRLHLEQEEGATDEPGGEGASDEAPPAGGAGTRAAIEDLGNRLKDAFESFGAAAKDPAVRADVVDIGALLKDALMTTFTTVSADVTGAVRKAGGRSGGAETDATQPPSSDGS